MILHWYFCCPQSLTSLLCQVTGRGPDSSAAVASTIDPVDQATGGDDALDQTLTEGGTAITIHVRHAEGDADLPASIPARVQRPSLSRPGPSSRRSVERLPRVDVGTTGRLVRDEPNSGVVSEQCKYNPGQERAQVAVWQLIHSPREF